MFDLEKVLHLQLEKDVGQVAYYELKTIISCTHLLAICTCLFVLYVLFALVIIIFW